MHCRVVEVVGIAEIAGSAPGFAAEPAAVVVQIAAAQTIAVHTKAEPPAAGAPAAA